MSTVCVASWDPFGCVFFRVCPFVVLKGNPKDTEIQLGALKWKARPLRTHTRTVEPSGSFPSGATQPGQRFGGAVQARALATRMEPNLSERGEPICGESMRAVRKT